MADGWSLAPVSEGDAPALHDLFSRASVFEFLFDGAAPELAVAEHIVARSWALFAERGFGAWNLVDQSGALAGIVSLAPDEAGDIELLYALAPGHCGRGLATSMALAALEHGFDRCGLTRIVAGVDGQNHGSIRVLERIGMRRTGAVDFPLGPGHAYAIDAGGPRPPAPVALRT